MSQSQLYLNEQGGVLKDRLRQETHDQAQRILGELEFLLHAERYHRFWQDLHQAIVDQYTDREKEGRLEVEAQLTTQDIFLGTWIKSTVVSEERFEFFIRSKAAEIRSGDDEHDYYWALKIRHDQLVALIRVETALVTWLKKLVGLPVAEALEEETFLGLIDYPVEKQIFLEAEKVQREREKIGT